MKIIFLGKPGSGKGTQAKILAKKLNIPHISTGDIIRQNIKDNTENGIIANTYISKGQLVPDELVLKLVKDRINKNDCEGGYIFDGFPRTIYQAEELAKINDIDRVININIDDSVIEKRLTSRRMCKNCGEIYSVANEELKTCKKCNGELIKRADDNVDVIRARIKEHNALSEPLVKYYKNKNCLVTIMGDESPEEVAKNIEMSVKR